MTMSPTPAVSSTTESSSHPHALHASGATFPTALPPPSRVRETPPRPCGVQAASANATMTTRIGTGAGTGTRTSTGSSRGGMGTMSSSCSSGAGAGATTGATRPRPKTFTCSVAGCRKPFSKKWNMQAHMRLHTGSTPFACRLGCGASYMWMSSRKGHELNRCRFAPYIPPELNPSRRPSRYRRAPIPMSASASASASVSAGAPEGAGVSPGLFRPQAQAQAQDWQQQTLTPPRDAPALQGGLGGVRKSTLAPGDGEPAPRWRHPQAAYPYARPYAQPYSRPDPPPPPGEGPSLAHATLIPDPAGARHCVWRPAWSAAALEDAAQPLRVGPPHAAFTAQPHAPVRCPVAGAGAGAPFSSRNLPLTLPPHAAQPAFHRSVLPPCSPSTHPFQPNGPPFPCPKAEPEPEAKVEAEAEAEAEADFDGLEDDDVTTTPSSTFRSATTPDPDPDSFDSMSHMSDVTTVNSSSLLVSSTPTHPIPVPTPTHSVLPTITATTTATTTAITATASTASTGTTTITNTTIPLIATSTSTKTTGTATTNSTQSMCAHSVGIPRKSYDHHQVAVENTPMACSYSGGRHRDSCADANAPAQDAAGVSGDNQTTPFQQLLSDDVLADVCLPDRDNFSEEFLEQLLLCRDAG